MFRALLSLAFVAALAVPAAAQDKTGIGVGAEAMLNGPNGASVVYDADAWRVNGILGFHDNGAQDVLLGARFVFVLHEGTGADFGVGGGFGLVMHDEPGGMGDNDTTDILIEGLVQLRAFIVPNVALSAAAGLGLVTGDGDDVEVTGQLVGSVGITYYFW